MDGLTVDNSRNAAVDSLYKSRQSSETNGKMPAFFKTKTSVHSSPSNTRKHVPFSTTIASSSL